MSDFEPHSRTAKWSRRLGLFSVAATIVSILVQRGGRLDTLTSLTALGASVSLAVLAVLLSAAAFILIWFRGMRGAGAALVGALTGAAVIAGPVALAAVFWKLPAISDVVTDPLAPPPFMLSTAERSPSDKAPVYPGGETAEAQIIGYPDIAPLQVNTSAAEVFPAALELAQKQGWRILSGTDAKGPHLRIEAVAATPILHMPQDVVVQISSNGTGSRIDMRSASRWGTRDFGTNARRIRNFLTELALALG